MRQRCRPVARLIMLRTGSNWGWDHWLDNHFGFTVSGRPLDSYVNHLRGANVSFRGHTGIGGANLQSDFSYAGGEEGSLWTGGVSGQVRRARL